MTAIVVALIAALGALGAALLSSRASVRSARLEDQYEALRAKYAEVEEARDACLRDRRQLRELLQMIAGAFVGLLPERERLTMLAAIDEKLDGDH